MDWNPNHLLGLMSWNINSRNRFSICRNCWIPIPWICSFMFLYAVLAVSWVLYNHSYRHYDLYLDRFMFMCLLINLYTYIVPNMDQQKIDLYINCVKVACLHSAQNPFLQNINPQKIQILFVDCVKYYYSSQVLLLY